MGSAQQPVYIVGTARRLLVWRARPFQEGEGSGIVAYTELCWRQDLVASNQIAASFHVTNKTLRVPRLIIRDTLVHSSLNMARGLDVLIEEASASLRYQSLKVEQKRAVKAFVEEIAVRIFVRARRVYLIAVESLHTAGMHNSAYAMPPDPSPLERVWPARLDDCVCACTCVVGWVGVGAAHAHHLHNREGGVSLLR